MKQEALQFYTDTHLQAFAMILFLITFAGMAMWVYRKKLKSHYEEMAKLPFKKDL